MSPHSRGSKSSSKNASGKDSGQTLGVDVNHAKTTYGDEGISPKRSKAGDVFPTLADDESFDEEEDEEDVDSSAEHEHESPSRQYTLSEPASPSLTPSSDDDGEPHSCNTTNHVDISGPYPSPPPTLQRQRTLPLSLPSASPPSHPPYQRTQSLYTTSTSSLSLPPTRPNYNTNSPAFAPPFYNRPPTPLPPSPSLTSLLRPPFTASAAPSRPASPTGSSSETETHAHIPHRHSSLVGVPGSNTTTLPPRPSTTATTNASTSTLAPAHRLQHLATSAPSHPSSFPPKPPPPTHAYYGFALYLSASALFLIYVIWSFLPTPFLHRLGVWYYPERWWSLAIPSWIVVLLVWVYVALACWNTEVLTKRVGELGCIVDLVGAVAVVDGNGRIVRKGGYGGRVGREDVGVGAGGAKKQKKKDKVRRGGVEWGQTDGAVVGVRGGRRLSWREVWSEGTDAVMDVPLGGVCEVLYGEDCSDDDDDDDE